MKSDLMDDELTIKKNKFDLQHQILLQERNAILLAIIGVPLTVFNILISIVKINAIPSTILAFISFWLLLEIKNNLDEKIESKLNELDNLLNKI